MNYTTNVTGTIDISGLKDEVKFEIRNHLSSLFTEDILDDFIEDDEIEIEDEWEEFNESEKFLIVMYHISRLIRKDAKGFIMCSGDDENDFWAIILKDNKVFTQRYELRPEGDIELYEKVRKK